MSQVLSLQPSTDLDGWDDTIGKKTQSNTATKKAKVSTMISKKL
jgi:hypothetical protein